jgi:hypothetical protein
VSVGKPFLELTGETEAISLEVLNNLNHLGTVFLYTGEGLLVPRSESGLGLLIETVELVEQVDFVFSLNELGVLLMGESEERLSSVSGVVLLLDNLEFVTFGLESFQSFVGSKTGLGRSVFDEGFPEVIDLNDEVLDVVDKALLELGFLDVHLLSDGIGLFNESDPSLVKGILVVTLVLVHDVGEVNLQEFVHLVDGTDLVREVGLLLADFLKGAHDATEGVNIDGGFVNLELDLLELVHEGLEHGLRFLVEILGESELPLLNPFSEGVLDLLSLEGEGSNLVVLLNQVDGLNDTLVVSESGLVVFELGVLGVEGLELLVHVLVPQPGVLIERGLERNNNLSSSLDGTSEEQDDLNDLLVTGNPSVERLALILGEVLLVPVLDLLGGLEDGGSSLVDGVLDLIKRRLEESLTSIKEDFHFEEGLETTSFLGSSAASTDSLLHLVKRVLGGV